MKQALLIADGRPHEDPNNMDISATQKSIEKFPLVISRHFMIRVAALVRAMKKYDSIFGGLLMENRVSDKRKSSFAYGGMDRKLSCI